MRIICIEINIRWTHVLSDVPDSIFDFLVIELSNLTIQN